MTASFLLYLALVLESASQGKGFRKMAEYDCCKPLKRHYNSGEQ